MVKTGQKKPLDSPGPAIVVDPKPRRDWNKASAWVAIATLGMGFLYFVYDKYSAHARKDFVNDVDNLIDAKLQEPNQKLDKLISDVGDVKGQLEILRPLIQEIVTRKLVASATISEKEYLAAIPDLRQTVTTATHLRVSMDNVIVEKAAKRAIDVSSSNAAAWPLATELLGYRSSLTAADAPALSPGTKTQPSTGWTMGPLVSNGPVDVSLPQGPVSPQIAFRFEPLGSDVNSRANVGPPLAFFDGRGSTSITIENYWVKNVVFKNATIVYHGGPLKLENVYFVNCKFEFAPKPNTRDLADKMVESVPVTFSTEPG
jgi:hypothetical protein